MIEHLADVGLVLGRQLKVSEDGLTGKTLLKESLVELLLEDLGDLAGLGDRERIERILVRVALAAAVETGGSGEHRQLAGGAGENELLVLVVEMFAERVGAA